jgi:ABC-type iron transport system FetAB ATPase subunit
VALLPAESGWWADRVGQHFVALGRATATAGRERLHQRLAQLGFAPDVLDWDVLRLSPGERQRLALVRLLENDPEVLLLDEATANLDPTNQTRAETLIDDYRQGQDAAVLWTSHDPEQRGRLSARANGRRLLLEAGRLQPEPSA